MFVEDARRVTQAAPSPPPTVERPGREGVSMKKLMIAAAFALALAAASGAFAAHKYLVTSSKQIKPGTISLANLSPSARKALLSHNSTTGTQGPKGDTGAAGPKGDNGASGVNSPLVFGPYNAKGGDSNFCGDNWANDTYKV